MVLTAGIIGLTFGAMVIIGILYFSNYSKVGEPEYIPDEDAKSEPDIRKPVRELVEYYNNPDNRGNFKIMRVMNVGSSRLKDNCDWYSSERFSTYSFYSYKRLKLTDQVKSLTIKFEEEVAEGISLREIYSYLVQIKDYDIKLSSDEQEYLYKNIAEKWDNAIIEECRRKKREYEESERQRLADKLQED